jgi:hypothetical protein
MTQGEDMSTALAKALVNGLDVEGAETIWRKINEKNAEMTGKDITEDRAPEPGDGRESGEEEEQSEPESPPTDPNKVVYVDFMTFVGRRRKRKKVTKVAMTQAELDEVIERNEEHMHVQLTLF